MLTRRAGFFVLVAALISGCTGPGSVSNTNAVLPAAIGERQAPQGSDTAYLYASDGAGRVVDVYAPGSTHSVRQISKALYGNNSIALDSAGTLFVANSQTEKSAQGYVGVYDPGSNVLKKRIVDGIYGPLCLAVDGQGNLYVANQGNGPTGNGWVTVYAAKTYKLLRKITKGIFKPLVVKIGPSGDLFVTSYTMSWITEYAPGSSTVLRTYHSGINSAVTMAFDGKGAMYVANYMYNASNVLVFPRANTTPARTITNSIVDPTDLIVDPVGRLYVATLKDGTNQYGDLLMFAPGKNKPARAIATQFEYRLTAMALDPNQNLYVAYYGYKGSGVDTGYIDVYAPLASKAKYRIDGQYASFSSLALGPN